MTKILNVILVAILFAAGALASGHALAGPAFSETVTEAEGGGASVLPADQWKPMRMEGLSGGEAISAETPGAALEFEFNGAAVSADMVVGKSGGKMSVSVDGNPVSVIDTYRGHMNPDSERMALANSLAPGPHTLRIEVLEERNPKSYGALIAVDTLRVADADYGAVTGVLESRYNQGLPVTRTRITAMGQDCETHEATDVTGEFALDALAPGTYTLRFERTGYETLEMTDLAVASGQEVALDKVLFAEKEGARPLTFIRSPLPTRPVFVRPGDEFTVVVAAPDSAGAWQAALQSPWAGADLELKNANYDAATGRWTLHVAVPQDVPSLLYKLTLTFSGGKDFQPRAVMVVPEFKDSLRVVHITDVHVYKSEILFERYRELAEEVNLVNPDVIIVTGDVTDSNGYTDDRWPESDQYPAMLDLWNAYNAPTFVLPGNHDLSPFHKQDDYERWLRFFDTIDYSFDVGPYHFTAFDDNYTMRSGTHKHSFAEDVFPEQLEWIEQDLSQNMDAAMRILLYHVPLHTSESKVKDLAAKYDVKLALYGHLHMNAVDELPPTTYVQTGAAYDGAYRVIHLENGEIGDMTGKNDGFTAFTTGTVKSRSKFSDDGRSFTLQAKNSSIMDLPGAAWRVEMPAAQDYTCDGCTVVSRYAAGDKTTVTFTFDLPAREAATAVLTAQ